MIVDVIFFEKDDKSEKKNQHHADKVGREHLNSRTFRPLIENLGRFKRLIEGV